MESLMPRARRFPRRPRRILELSLAVLATGCASALPLAPEPEGSEPAVESRAEDAAPARAHDSVPGFFETHFSSDAWFENVWRDYLTEPPVLLPAGLAVGALAVSPWDESLQRNMQGKLGNTPELANYTLGALVVGSLGAGLFAPGPGRTAWDETWNQVEAFSLSVGTTSLLKTLVHRRRPHGSTSDSSFPSGHSSAAFTAAMLLECNSGDALGIPAFGLAAVTAFSRVESGRHFPSDVLAGAAIGCLSAGIVDALHFGTGREGRGIARQTAALEIGPGPDGGLQVALSIRF